MAGRHSQGRVSAPDKASSAGWKRTALRLGITAAVGAVVILGFSLFNSQKVPTPSPVAQITSTPTTATLSPTETTGSPAATGAGAATRTPTPTSPRDTTQGSGAAVAPGIYATVIKDLASVVPSQFAGYDEGNPENQAGYVSVPLQPNSSGPADKVRMASVTIADAGSASKAAAFVSGIAKAYSKNVHHATVGAVTGIFATNGTNTAVLRYARGRYTIEVLVFALSGVPLSLESQATALGSALPASH